MNRSLLLVLALLTAGLSPEPCLAQGLEDVLPFPGLDAGKGKDGAGGAEEGSGEAGPVAEPAREGWDLYLNFLLVLLAAIAVGALLAYHPCHLGNRSSLGAMDHPKIIITYTVVGALCGVMILIEPATSLVIFAIGGLMRFRTELGAAHETGRVILATLIGIFCGLELWFVVIVSTAVSWMLILVLDWKVGVRMIVRGVRSERVAEAAQAYRAILEQYPVTVTQEKKNPRKKQFSFVLRAPRSIDRDLLEEEFAENVEESLQGTVDWPAD